MQAAHDQTSLTSIQKQALNMVPWVDGLLLFGVCCFYCQQVVSFQKVISPGSGPENISNSYTCLYALVPNNKSSWRRDCLFFSLSPSLGVWEFEYYTTHYYSIQAWSWAFKKVYTATECITAEIITFTKNIYLLKKRPKNVVPANGFDCKIKYFLID